MNNQEIASAPAHPTGSQQPKIRLALGTVGSSSNSAANGTQEEHSSQPRSNYHHAYPEPSNTNVLPGSTHDVNSAVLPPPAQRSHFPNNNCAVTWSIPKQNNRKDLDMFYRNVISSAQPLVSGAGFYCRQEIWFIINTPDATLQVTTSDGRPVTFDDMNKGVTSEASKERGPFYCAKDNVHYTLFKLRFNSKASYTLTWDCSKGIATYLIKCTFSGTTKRSRDDSTIGTKSQLPNYNMNSVAEPTFIDLQPDFSATSVVYPSMAVYAILPADYTVHYSPEIEKEISNIVFLLPEDLNHHACIIKALQDLKYESRNEVFFSSQHRNVLLCNIEHYLVSHVLSRTFNECLLFVPSTGNIQSVNQVTIPNEDDLTMEVRVGLGGRTVQFEQLTNEQQVIARYFKKEQRKGCNGFMTLSNAAQANSAKQFHEYLKCWLFLSKGIMQRDIFITIKVEPTNVIAQHDAGAIQLDQYAQCVTDTLDELLEVPVTLEVDFFGSINVVVSGPSITWWLINQKRDQIAQSLAARNMTLLDISLTSVKSVTTAMKDPRNAPFRGRMFALVCKMLNNTVHRDCVRQNSATTLKPRRTGENLVSDALLPSLWRAPDHTKSIHNRVIGSVDGDKVIAGQKTRLRFDSELDISAFDGALLKYLVDGQQVFVDFISSRVFERSGPALVCTLPSPLESTIRRYITPTHRGNTMVTIQLYTRTLERNGKRVNVVVQSRPVPFTSATELKQLGADSSTFITNETTAYDFKVTVDRKGHNRDKYTRYNWRQKPLVLWTFQLVFQEYSFQVVPTARVAVPLKLAKATSFLLRSGVHGVYGKDISVENRNDKLYVIVQGSEYQCPDNRLALAGNMPQLQRLFGDEDKQRISNEPTHFEAANGLLMITTTKHPLTITTSVDRPVAFTVRNNDSHSSYRFKCEGYTITFKNRPKDSKYFNADNNDEFNYVEDFHWLPSDYGILDDSFTNIIFIAELGVFDRLHVPSALDHLGFKITGNAANFYFSNKKTRQNVFLYSAESFMKIRSQVPEDFFAEYLLIIPGPDDITPVSEVIGSSSESINLISMYDSNATTILVDQLTVHERAVVKHFHQSGVQAFIALGNANAKNMATYLANCFMESHVDTTEALNNIKMEIAENTQEHPEEETTEVPEILNMETNEVFHERLPLETTAETQISNESPKQLLGFVLAGDDRQELCQNTASLTYFDSITVELSAILEMKSAEITSISSTTLVPGTLFQNCQIPFDLQQKDCTTRIALKIPESVSQLTLHWTDKSFAPLVLKLHPKPTETVADAPVLSTPVGEKSAVLEVARVKETKVKGFKGDQLHRKIISKAEKVNNATVRLSPKSTYYFAARKQNVKLAASNKHCKIRQIAQLKDYTLFKVSTISNVNPTEDVDLTFTNEITGGIERIIHVKIAERKAPSNTPVNPGQTKQATAQPKASAEKPKTDANKPSKPEATPTTTEKPSDKKRKASEREESSKEPPKKKLKTAGGKALSPKQKKK